MKLGISELARLAQMQPSALRYYEKEGLLSSSGRLGGRRVFDEQGVLQLATIEYWREAGFSLKEMAKLFNDSSAGMEEARRIAAERVTELDRLISEAVHVKEVLSRLLGCGQPRLSECPYYIQALRDRAEKIVNGEYQRWERSGGTGEIGLHSPIPPAYRRVRDGR
ncbi:MerR family transcriptional regulator [Amycolatopsis azurea]|uniref:MerR family transcriptional regulator n=1 Tax=Amycolatopsis azurea TaxID=36819 RepID=UPI003804149C